PRSAAHRASTPKATKQLLRRWTPYLWKLSRLILVGGQQRFGLRRIGSVGRLRRGGGLESLPASAERLEQIDRRKQQLRIALVRTDANAQARALRIEQRQQIDLPSVVQRLRTSERRVRRRGSGLQGFSAQPLVVERN